MGQWKDRIPVTRHSIPPAHHGLQPALAFGFRSIILCTAKCNFVSGFRPSCAHAGTPRLAAPTQLKRIDPTLVLVVLNGRTSPTLPQPFCACVFQTENAHRSRWMRGATRCGNRSSGPAPRFMAQANDRIMDQYPRAVWIAALRLCACPVPMARQALAPHAANRRSRIVSPPVAHRVLVALCRHWRQAEYWHCGQSLARRCGRFQSVRRAASQWN
jgi:hypothetical protein